jgi:hypothetical protein
VNGGASASATLLLGNVSAASLSSPALQAALVDAIASALQAALVDAIASALQAALVDAIASALGVAPEDVTLSGLASSTGGTTLGVVVSGASLADATALAAALTALLPSLSPTSGFAGALASVSPSLANVTALGGASVAPAVPSTGVTASLTLAGAGLSALTFGAAQQSAFLAGLRAFLGASADVALTAIVDAPGGGVSLSFEASAIGPPPHPAGCQACRLRCCPRA